MDSTWDKFAQFRKGNLSKQNLKLNKHAQKLIVTLYIDQEVSGISLLIYKKGLRVGVIHARRRAIQWSAVGGGCG